MEGLSRGQGAFSVSGKENQLWVHQTIGLFYVAIQVASMEEAHGSKYPWVLWLSERPNHRAVAEEIMTMGHCLEF